LYKTFDNTPVTAYPLLINLSLNKSLVWSYPTSDSSGLSERIKVVSTAG